MEAVAEMAVVRIAAADDDADADADVEFDVVDIDVAETDLTFANSVYRSFY